jgi:predicted kinase
MIAFMLTVFVMIGISGSGKSTYADLIYKRMVLKNEPVVIVRTDDIREELTGNASDQSKNAEVFKLAHKRLEESLAVGMSVIFDATNLSTDDRAPIIKVAKKYNARTVAIVMKTPMQVSIDRNRSRTRVVPTPVIWRQYNRFKIPSTGEFDYVESI